MTFDEGSLDQFLAAAVDAAQKAGQVSLSLSLFLSLEFDRSSAQIWILLVLRCAGDS